MLDDDDVRCGLIGSIDLLSISGTTHDGAVYVVASGKARLAARGSIVASGTRHALIRWDDNARGKADYLEVFAR